MFPASAKALPVACSATGISVSIFEGVSELESRGVEEMVAGLGEAVREHCAEGDSLGGARHLRMQVRDGFARTVSMGTGSSCNGCESAEESSRRGSRDWPPAMRRVVRSGGARGHVGIEVS